MNEPDLVPDGDPWAQSTAVTSQERTNHGMQFTSRGVPPANVWNRRNCVNQNVDLPHSPEF